MNETWCLAASGEPPAYFRTEALAEAARANLDPLVGARSVVYPLQVDGVVRGTVASSLPGRARPRTSIVIREVR